MKLGAIRLAESVLLLWAPHKLHRSAAGVKGGNGLDGQVVPNSDAVPCDAVEGD